MRGGVCQPEGFLDGLSGGDRDAESIATRKWPPLSLSLGFRLRPH